MGRNKLFKILSAFSKRELIDFHSFLKCPLFNQSQTLIELFEYIRPYHPHFDFNESVSEDIFFALRPEKDFTPKFVNDRFSDLTKLAKDFLAIQYIYKNPEKKKEAIRNSLKEHELHDLFLKETEKEIEKLKAKPRLTQRSSYKLWALNYEIFSHPFTHTFQEKDNQSFEMMGYLDTHYVIIKLRYFLHQSLRKGIFKDNTPLPFQVNIFDLYSNNKNITIQWYIKLLETLKKGNTVTSWENLYSLFTLQLEIIPDEEKLEILTAIINLGFRLAILKNPELFKKILHLYQIGLEENLWVRFGMFPEQTFKNIVILGSSTKNFLFTENFITKYQRFLPVQEKSNVVFYASAYLRFYKGEFEKAISLLDKPRQLRLDDKLSYKSLRSRCLYELRCINPDYETLLSTFLSAFDRFLRTKKLTDERKIAYKNFIRVLVKLNKAKASFQDKTKLRTKLKDYLEQCESIIAYHWILEKVEKL